MTDKWLRYLDPANSGEASNAVKSAMPNWFGDDLKDWWAPRITSTLHPLHLPASAIDYDANREAGMDKTNAFQESMRNNAYSAGVLAAIFGGAGLFGGDSGAGGLGSVEPSSIGWDPNFGMGAGENLVGDPVFNLTGTGTAGGIGAGGVVGGSSFPLTGGGGGGFDLSKMLSNIGGQMGEQSDSYAQQAQNAASMDNFWLAQLLQGRDRDDKHIPWQPLYTVTR